MCTQEQGYGGARRNLAGVTAMAGICGLPLFLGSNLSEKEQNIRNKMWRGAGEWQGSEKCAYNHGVAQNPGGAQIYGDSSSL